MDWIEYGFFFGFGLYFLQKKMFFEPPDFSISFEIKKAYFQVIFALIW